MKLNIKGYSKDGIDDCDTDERNGFWITKKYLNARVELLFENSRHSMVIGKFLAH